MNLHNRLICSLQAVCGSALLTFCAQPVLSDTITLTMSAPTVGYGPPPVLGIGGPFFTYTPASASSITLNGTPIVLNSITQNFGTYTYNPGELLQNSLNLTLSVTPTVNGNTATTPLDFNGILEKGAHPITQPTPYLLFFDPTLNPSAQFIVYNNSQFLALPFDGYLFGVDLGSFLSYPAYDNATVAPIIGFIAPVTPEPATLGTVATVLAFLVLYSLRTRRRSCWRALRRCK